MKAQANKITINGVEYVSKGVGDDSPTKDIRIVILQRGWSMIGEWHRDGSDCRLTNASVIRRWGTSQGLGQLAKNGGPLSETVLDKCHGDVEFDYLTVVATIKCEADEWAKNL